MTVLAHPSTTWRAVSHAPLSATEKAVPLPGPGVVGPLTTTEGSKGDKADARKLAELLRTGMVRSVWHGRQTTRGLKEMVRAYETFAIDSRRTMLRIKALYRSRGIPTTGTGVYQVKRREHWLKQLTEVGMQQRAAWLYQQLDNVRELRKQSKAAVLAEGHATTGSVAANDSSSGTGPGSANRRHCRHSASIPNEATVLEL
jgi:hypothetical protein